MCKVITVKVFAAMGAKKIADTVMLKLLQHLHPLNYLNITRLILKGCSAMKKEPERSRSNSRTRNAIAMVKG